LMFPAQVRLAEDLAKIEFRDLRFPIVENVSAEVNAKGARARTALTEQVSSPVRWAQSVETLLAEEVGTFIEVGTGKVLCGLVRQINRDVRCLNVENNESLQSSLASLQG
jgi:[acyl-carrier-protein] S-malonyltransferase